jgi:hypothetical protein
MECVPAASPEPAVLPRHVAIELLGTPADHPDVAWGLTGVVAESNHRPSIKA